MLADLRALGPVAAVHGNVDSGALRDELPEALSLELEGVVLAVIHERDGFQVFNPGSPTERRGSSHRSMGEATIGGGQIEFCHVRLD